MTGDLFPKGFFDELDNVKLADSSTHADLPPVPDVVQARTLPKVRDVNLAVNNQLRNIENKTGVPLPALNLNPKAHIDNDVDSHIASILNISPKLNQAMAARDYQYTKNKDEWDRLGSFEKVWTSLKSGFRSDQAGGNLDDVASTQIQLNDDRIALSALKKLQANKFDELTPDETAITEKLGFGRTRLNQTSLAIPSYIEYLRKQIRLRESNLKIDADDAIRHIEALRKLPQSPELNKVAQAKTFSEGFSSFFESPLQVTVHGLAGSAFPMFKSLGGAAVGGVVAGPPGFTAGLGVGSFSANYNSKYLENVLERNPSIKTPEDILKLFSDREAVREIRSAAIRYSAGVSAFEMLGGFIATKTLRPTVLQNVVAQTGVQATTGGAGEIAGQILEKGHISAPGEAVLEFMLEIPGGVPEIAIGIQLQRSQNRKVKLDKSIETVSKSQDLNRLVDIFKNSQARKQDPQTVKDILKTIADEDIGRSLTVSSDDMSTFFQENPDIERNLVINNSGLHDRYQRALASRASFTIDLTDYLVYFSDYHEKLQEILHIGDDTITIGDAKITLENFDESYKSLQDQVASEMDDILQEANRTKTLLERVTRQLTDTYKFTESEAQDSAVQFVSAISTLANRANLDPNELYDRVGLQVTSRLTGLRARDKIEGIVKNIQKFKPSSRRLLRGPSLTEALIESGIATNESILYLRLDDAAAQAAQNKARDLGFDVNDDLNKFIEQVENDLVNHSTFAEDNTDQVRIDRETAMQRVIDALNTAGFDITDEVQAREGIERFTRGELPVENTVEFEQGKKRGSIQFPTTGLGTGPTLINLTENSNLSTFLHESGHLYLELLRDLAPVSPEIESMLAQVKQWWLDNVKDTLIEKGKRKGQVKIPGIMSQLSERNPEISKTISESDIEDFINTGLMPENEAENVILNELHEYFARGYEAYLFEGKAPDAKLRNIFERFTEWLVYIYKSIRAFRVRLDNNIRDVFDRILASNDAITNAINNSEFEPAFANPEDSQMTDEQWVEYNNLIDTVTTEAKRKIRARTLGALRKRRTKEFQDKVKQLKAEVETDINANPFYQAMHFLFYGENLDPDNALTIRPIKIDFSALVDMYGKKQAAAITEQMPKEKGKTLWRKRKSNDYELLHPDDIASMFNIESGDYFIQRITQLPPRSIAIKTESERRANIEFNDPITRRSLQQDAEEALQTAKEQLLISELDQLNKLSNHPDTPAAFAKQIARDAVGKLKTFEVSRLSTFRNAELKAGKKVEKAILANDYAEAARQKRIQLVNHYMYRDVIAADKIVNKGLRYVRTLIKPSIRKRVEVSAMDQIDSIIDRFDFSVLPLKEVKRREGIREFLHRKFEAGEFPEDVELPEIIALEDVRRNYKELSINEFVDVLDYVKTLHKLGRDYKKLLTAKENLDIDDAVAAIKRSTEDTNRERKPDPIGAKKLSKIQKIVETFRGIDAEMLGMEQIIDWLDGGLPNGPAREFIFNVMADAEVAENDLNLALTVKIVDMLDTHFGRKDLLKEHFINSMGRPLTKNEIISIALNLGTESNLKKLQQGSGFTDAMIEEALTHLTRDDWKFVQDTWQTLRDLWQRIVDVEIQTTGLRPKPLTERKVQTPFGEIQGGYYPVVYDPTLSDAGSKQQDASYFEEGFARPVVDAGMTVTRNENFSAPLLLDLSVLPRHISKVVHLITHKPAVRDVNKIISHPEFQELIRRFLGDPYLKQFKYWLKALASSKFISDPASGMFTKMLNGLRRNTSVAVMGFKWTTHVVQTMGLFAGAEIFTKPDAHGRTIGKTYLTKAVAQYYKHPIAMTELIRSLSGEMRHRMNSIDRDLREQYQKIIGQSGKIKALQRLAMKGIGIIDMGISSPVWLGVYNWAKDNGYTDDAAIHFADSRVRLSQSTGSIKDLSAIQRAENIKIFTMFFGYFRAMYGRTRDIMRDAKNGVNFFNVMMRSFWLFVPAAILGEWLAGRGHDCDEGDTLCKLRWYTMKTLTYPFMSVPLIRDAAAGIDSGFAASIPQLALVDAVINVGNELVDTVFSDEELNIDRIVKNTWRATGYFLGLPTAQPEITGSYVWDYFTGEEQDSFNPMYLLIRRPRE